MSNQTDKNIGGMLQIANALVWAALMLVVAWLSPDNDNNMTITLFMICGWFTTNGLLDRALGNKEQCKPKQS